MEIQALIIDDEPQSVQVLKDTIDWNRLGIGNVFGANSAPEARKLMDQEPVQLILCDIEMPGESGLDFIQWLRDQANLNGKNIECIILTCFPDYSYMRKAMQIGCSDYLIKPAQTSEVETVIEKAIQKIQTWEIAEASLQSISIKESDSNNQIVDQVILPYINDHFTDVLTVTEIAEHAALNPQYMMRLFKKTTGLSVLEYVTKLRMDLAKQYLEQTSWTNDFIAGEIGYASANYFIKLFKETFGMTPREFRKRVNSERHN